MARGAQGGGQLWLIPAWKSCEGELQTEARKLRGLLLKAVLHVHFLVILLHGLLNIKLRGCSHFSLRCAQTCCGLGASLGHASCPSCPSEQLQVTDACIVTTFNFCQLPLRTSKAQASTRGGGNTCIPVTAGPSLPLVGGCSMP